MDNQQLAENITKALGYTENGGKPDIKNTKAGKTGESKSIFQFEPATWKNYAQQVTGNPDLPLTPDNETGVVIQKVSQWLDKGYKPDEIASMWNAGVGEPDAYSGKFSDGSPSKGVNKKYGVQYDVPGYVSKFNKYLTSFGSENTESASTPTAGSTPAVAPQVAQPTPSQSPQVTNKSTSGGYIGGETPKILGILNKSKGMLKT